MLNQEQQRRLAEIEAALTASDASMAKRFKRFGLPASRARHRLTYLLLLLTWLSLIGVAVTGALVPALIIAGPLAGLTAAAWPPAPSKPDGQK